MPTFEIQLGGVGERCKLPHWGLGETQADFYYGAVSASQMASGWG